MQDEKIKMNLLTSKEHKKIVEQLNRQFGINEIPFQILRFGENKYRIFSGSLEKKELEALDKELRIENCGLYFAKIEPDGIRLTLDGIQIFKNQITKNILELNENQAQEWLKGNEIYTKTERDFKILKNQGEFIGCGKATGEKIANFMPKERRIK